MDFDELQYFDFTPYTEVNLIAYSYGVWAANRAYLSKSLPLDINKSVAISGTFCPVHPLFGINPKVYNPDITHVERTIENLREELINIKAQSSECRMEYGFSFDTVILTKNDKIFPFKAQEAFFEKHPNKVILETGHFPFFEFKTLDNILEA